MKQHALPLQDPYPPAILRVPHSTWIERARLLWNIGNRSAFRWAMRHARRTARTS